MKCGDHGLSDLADFKHARGLLEDNQPTFPPTMISVINCKTPVAAIARGCSVIQGRLPVITWRVGRKIESDGSLRGAFAKGFPDLVFFATGGDVHYAVSSLAISAYE